MVYGKFFRKYHLDCCVFLYHGLDGSSGKEKFIVAAFVILLLNIHDCHNKIKVANSSA